jgi:hypothetical protein
MNIFDSPKDCIRTNSGIYMNVFEPTLDMIDINDIAHVLSNLPRFGGHLDRFYSVAQHSVMCTMRVKSVEDKRAVLYMLPSFINNDFRNSSLSNIK